MPSVPLRRLLATTSLAVLLLVGPTALAPTDLTADTGKRGSKTVGAPPEAAPATTKAVDPGIARETHRAPTMALPVALANQRNARLTVATPMPTTAPTQRLAEPETSEGTSNQPTAERSPAAVATPAPMLNPPPVAPVIPGAAEVEPAHREHRTLYGDDAMIVIVPPAMPGAAPVPIPAALPEAKPAAILQVKPAEEMPAPATAIDAPIAEQLHNLPNGKFDRLIGNGKERESIDAFYLSRNYAPLWITEGKANARATAAIAYLSRVDIDGLDPADYPVPNFASLSDPAALAEAEVRLTTSVVTYAHHAQIGRIHWSRVSADIFYDAKAPETGAVLNNIAGAEDVGEALAAYEPHAAEYLALKAKLAEIRAGRSGTGKPRIPNGPSLNIGMQDQRVPLLRLRLGVAGEAGAIYDRALADAVKRFQQAHGLGATGMLNAATVEALNGRPSDAHTDIILANMERWRWMPHNLGKMYVIVNLPDYTLRVIRQGKQVWMAKIVAGKPATPTPLISAQMKSITINPIWNVPASIANNEYLPLLQQDPTILQRMGLIVSYNPDGTIHLAQPPGEQNALGRIRFNFPNKFLVYQHDSNQKQFFANEKRAESHGCMRVQDPLKYAEVLLSLVRPGEGLTQERIHALYGDNEVEIRFPAPLPVHVTYQTAFVSNRGQLEFRGDLYGHDQALLALMKGPERKVADIPIQRRDNMTRRQLLAMPDNGRGANGVGSYDGGRNSFTRLFGDPFAQPATVQRQPVVQPRVQ
jgi:L,D-transpeptidase YcbB